MVILEHSDTTERERKSSKVNDEMSLYSQPAPALLEQRKRKAMKATTVSKEESSSDESSEEDSMQNPQEEQKGRKIANSSKGKFVGNQLNKSSSKSQQQTSTKKKAPQRSKEESDDDDDDEDEDSNSSDEEEKVPKQKREQQDSKKDVKIGSNLARGVSSNSKEELMERERKNAFDLLGKTEGKNNEFAGIGAPAKRGDEPPTGNFYDIPRSKITTEKSASLEGIDAYATIKMYVKFSVTLKELETGAESTVWTLNRKKVKAMAVDALLQTQKEKGSLQEGSYVNIKKRASQAKIMLKELDYQQCYNNMDYNCAVHAPGISAMNGLDVHEWSGGLVVPCNSEYKEVNEKYINQHWSQKSLIDEYGRLSKIGMRAQLCKHSKKGHFTLEKGSDMHRYIRSNAKNYGFNSDQLDDERASPEGQYKISNNVAEKAKDEVRAIRDGLPIQDTLVFVLRPADMAFENRIPEEQGEDGSNGEEHYNQRVPDLKYTVQLICTAKILIVA